jgi:hypothetical protein
MGYPTEAEIWEMFKLQENDKAMEFFNLHVRDDAVWTVMVRKI